MHQVICSLGSQVFCSVTDVDRCMAEVKRVLRPGGKFLFMEHIGAKPGGILRAMQQLMNPLWKFSFENCNLDRDTLAQIRRSGGSECTRIVMCVHGHKSGGKPVVMLEIRVAILRMMSRGQLDRLCQISVSIFHRVIGLHFVGREDGSKSPRSAYSAIM